MVRLVNVLQHSAGSGLQRLNPALAQRIAVHRQLELGGMPKYVDQGPDVMLPSVMLGAEGIDLHEKEQVERLESWSAYSDLYGMLRGNREINLSGGFGKIVNGWYQTPNAEIYASMIADFRPSSILEVGVGYSTRLAREVIRELDLNTQIVAVDPRPRTSVEEAADALVSTTVEEAQWNAPPFPPLAEPLMLFIDSSHVTRAGGDIPVLFNQLIPRLAPGSIVHVDDVFIPWDYPTAYRQRLYTEQYVLQALLTGSDRFKTIFASHFMSRTHSGAMAAIVNSHVGLNQQFLGSSYWFEVR